MSDLQEYQKQSLSQVAGKTAAGEEPSHPRKHLTACSPGKAIANTRTTQVISHLPAVTRTFALRKRKTSQPPGLGTVFYFFRVTSQTSTKASFPSNWLCHCRRKGFNCDAVGVAEFVLSLCGDAMLFQCSLLTNR